MSRSFSHVLCRVAKMLTLLDVQRGDHVLVVGAGTGYTNCIVGKLLGGVGVNHGVEIKPHLVEFAKM